ncbi:helix-turn-helix domain-containing protein [Nocardia alni]|uniref:helix-turn-helix domain-containing protein n=1 Tax=Nocardia alni TaxID=2815723 RepID=UPI001C214EFE|nr:helix-turn-helix transcriptional regulator [Nocardia alni]
MTRHHPPAVPPAAEPSVSPLRQARLDRHATLEHICAELDERSESGSSGVHPGMLSKWETGIHHTSAKYRRMLSDYYGRPAESLFAHQDQHRDHPAVAPQLVHTHSALQAAMLTVVTEAREYLVGTGSRSRDPDYLHAIEDALARREHLVHYRVLFGPPRHRILTEHLLRLMELRDPADRSHGVKTLHISMIDNPDYPERHLLASERGAVVTIPSLTSAEGFDTAIVLGTREASRYIEHGRQLYLCGRRLETNQALTTLTP